MAYIPHTDAEIKEMLETIGVSRIEDLFDEIPKPLRAKQLNPEIVPEALTEMQATREFRNIAKQDEVDLNFIGAGAYEHYIPAAVWQITSRGEFLTAYTPYQAEASQGSLQVIYEYQTMMAKLLGMDVANASLYDGASAVAEASLMAIRCHKKSKSKHILAPQTLHPYYRKVLKTIVSQQGIKVTEIPYCTKQGITLTDALAKYSNEDITALIIPQPNFFGCIEDVDALTNWAHQHDVIAIGVINPLTMALLKEPGQWGKQGVDIACGEGQSMGVPLAFGGPYFGFLATRMTMVRQMPGRLVGRTIDANGKTGYTLTLQAREQHIRRSKATSNICTNQGLLVTAATIYMSTVGPQGLQQAAGVSHQNTQALIKLLKSIKGVEEVFTTPYFYECVIRLNQPVKQVLNELAKHGIQGGFDLTDDYPELGQCLLVCATETKTEDDLAYYAKHMQEALKKHHTKKPETVL